MKKAILSTLVLSLLLSPMLTAQRTEVNVETSAIQWMGKKIGSEHHGELDLKSGFLEMQDGRIVGGMFTVDMTTLRNTDLKSEDRNQRLVGHLKSDDFFSVDQYPTSTLHITGGTGFENDKATVNGNITIKGKTEPISFETERHNMGYTARLLIDRSKFDVRYGSDSFFDNLGDNAIDDIFTVDIQLVMK